MTGVHTSSQDFPQSFLGLSLSLSYCHASATLPPPTPLTRSPTSPPPSLPGRVHTTQVTPAARHRATPSRPGSDKAPGLLERPLHVEVERGVMTLRIQIDEYEAAEQWTFGEI